MQTERGPVGDNGPTGCFRVLRGGVAGAFIACCLLVLSTAVDKVGVGPGVGFLTPEALRMRFLLVSLLPVALFGFVAGAAVVAEKLTGDGMPRLAGASRRPT